MGTISETGHAINIDNAKKLIDVCVTFGSTVYQPSNPDITTANMTAKWTIADTAHQTLTSAEQLAKEPINARELLFGPFDKFVTRVINHFKGTKADKLIKADAVALANRFRGFKIKVIRLPNGDPDPAHNSTSHQSFVQKADVFKKLIDLLESDSHYVPNEADLQIVALRASAAQMKSLNENIETILAPVDLARITRDKTLYEDETGFLDIAQACRDYVKGVFGARAAETRLVTRIKFKRPKKK